MNVVAKLKMILAYEFSGQKSFESCDIPTRERIEKLIPKLIKATRKSESDIDPDDLPNVNLEQMTTKQLRVKARALGMPGNVGRMSRDELLDNLHNALM